MASSDEVPLRPDVVAASTAGVVLASKCGPSSSSCSGPCHPWEGGFTREGAAAETSAAQRERRRRCREGCILVYAAVSLALAAAVSTAFLPVGGDVRDDVAGPNLLVFLPLIALVVAAVSVEHMPFLAAGPHRTIDCDYFNSCAQIEKLAKLAKLAKGPQQHRAGICKGGLFGCIPTCSIRRTGGKRRRGHELMAGMPPMPAPWAPPPRPPRVWAGLLETSVFLSKLLVFVAFGCHAEQLRPSDDNTAALARASRTCLIVDALVCGILGLILGHAARSMPNVFSEDRFSRPRNIFSIHLLCLGSLIGFLGVGIRGLHRGNWHVDSCFAAGFGAPSRIAATVILDIPHLVIGSLFLSGSTGSSFLGLAVVVAAAAGLALGTKTYWVDVWWFSYGASYRRRMLYLETKVVTGFRWAAMQRKLRDLKHDLRIKKEAERRVPKECDETATGAGGAGAIVPGTGAAIVVD
eukprot:gnl/TRDRNA2_/TRDRNA2_191829_c0_seq1.p1 gnl/TRDRNA2_/TRDRNA2_191829_c0~~gnl/TRDRNA2_/TRDRNA2_191829_c0_seq1.p1  ORF type:complete len:491 (-),score=52.33 gnl/TRDRNA2_/TRDRNA2_191829_c0_seq1:292-1686(-)